MSTQNPFNDALDGDTPTTDTPSAGTLPDAPPSVDENLPETIEDQAPAVTDNGAISREDLENADTLGDRITDGLASRVADALAEAMAWTANSLSSMFTNSPDITISQTEGSTGSLVQMMMPFTVVVMVLSLVFLAIRLGMSAFRPDPAVGADLGGFLGRVFLVGTIFFPFVAALQNFLRNFSRSVIDDATLDGSLGENMLAATDVVGQFTDPIVAVLLLFVFFLVMLISSFLCLVFLTLKSVPLILLVGLVPFIAGISGMRPGLGAFVRYISWIAAVLAIEPAMALVYAHGFNLMGERPIVEGGIGMFMVGTLTVMFVALTPFAVLGLMAAGFAVVGAVGGGAALAGSAAAATRYAAGAIDRRTGKVSAPAGAGGEGRASRHSQQSTTRTTSSATGSAQTGRQGPAGNPGSKGASKGATAAHTGARAAGTAAGGPAGGAAASAASKGVEKAATGAKNVSRRTMGG